MTKPRLMPMLMLMLLPRAVTHQEARSRGVGVRVGGLHG